MSRGFRFGLGCGDAQSAGGLRGKRQVTA